MVDPVQPPEAAPPTDSSSSSPSVPSTAPRKAKRTRLRPTEKAFVLALTDPSKPSFLNATKAYQASHPNAKSEKGCGVNASRALDNDRIRAEVDRILNGGGVTEQWITDQLLEVAQTARSSHKVDSWQTALMNLAKLKRLIVDRQEVTAIDDTQKDAMRRLVNEALEGKPN